VEQNAILIAKIFGPVVLCLGFWMLLQTKSVIYTWENFKQTPSCLFLFGFINLLLGCCVINLYNIWILDKTIFVTILGWVLAFRGVITILCPKFVHKNSIIEASSARLGGLFPLVWGIILCWVGFR